MKTFVSNIILISLLFYSGKVASQAKWDSISRPNVYAAQVDLSNSFDHSENDIVFLGNSITFWGNWVELLGLPHAKNRGIPGDTTFGVLERLDSIAVRKPAKLFIMIGINDLSKNVPDSIIIKNYKRIIVKTQRLSPSTEIYFHTILPTNPTFQGLSGHDKRYDHIRKINTALEKLALQYDFVVIDLYSRFVDQSGNLSSNLTWDGTHLTKKGYELWRDILRNGNYLNQP